MRFVLWTLKLALFLLVLSFAVKNTDIVAVRYYLGYQWQAPLVLVLLAFFCLGVLVGIVSSLSHMLRQRRAIVALRRELSARGQAAPAAPPPAGAAGAR
jgi:lipopolysaccharide assembly protein A